MHVRFQAYRETFSKETIEKLFLSADFSVPFFYVTFVPFFSVTLIFL